MLTVVERYGAGRLVPRPGTPEALRYRYFMHYAEGSLMPPVLVSFICAKVKSARLPFFVKPIARKIADGVDAQYSEPNLRRHIAFLESELGRSTWFAGEALTAADIQMSYPVEALLARAGTLVTNRPLRDFLDRVHARPAYQRAIERGGPFSPA